MPITAVIADDEPLARKRIRRLLHAASEVTVVGEAGDGEEALRIVDETAIPSLGLASFSGGHIDGPSRHNVITKPPLKRTAR